MDGRPPVPDRAQGTAEAKSRVASSSPERGGPVNGCRRFTTGSPVAHCKIGRSSNAEKRSNSHCGQQRGCFTANFIANSSSNSLFPGKLGAKATQPRNGCRTDNK